MTPPLHARLFRLGLVALPALLAGAALADPEAYVGNFKDNTVSVVDTATAAVSSSRSRSPKAHTACCSARAAGRGRTYYVSGDGSLALSVVSTTTDRVAVIDTDSGRELGNVPVP